MISRPAIRRVGPPRVEETPTMSNDKTRSVVVAAGEVVTRDGRKHKQGAEVNLPDVEARDLIRAGVVREASAKPAAKKEG
jgi:hypothetical protein